MAHLRTALQSLEWAIPTNLRVRGSVVVLGGRGETPEVYNRFGNRIASDAYQVLAFSEAFGNEDQVVSSLRAAIASGELAAPVVVVGSDVGAVAAIDVASQLGSEIAAVIVAAYPAPGSSFVAADWESELLERTTCPMHRGVLDADTGVARGTLSEALDPDRITRDLGSLTQQVLAIHGGDDLVSPIDAVLPIYESATNSQIWVVEGAKHDVLNDSTHRTTAAVVVQFLEALRVGAAQPIARRIR